MSKDVNSFQNYFNNESSQVYASTKKIFRSGHIQLNIRDANNARARKSIIVISFRPRSLQRTSLERAFLAYLLLLYVVVHYLLFNLVRTIPFLF